MADLREQGAAGMRLAAQLAGDKKFRKHVVGAARHASRARQRAARQIGWLSLVGRLASDPELRLEVREMWGEIQGARDVLQSRRNRSHVLRNGLLLAWFGGCVALVLRKCGPRISTLGSGATPRVIESSIEVAVPVSVVYSQWTQFEEFPRFMQGVDEVRRLDDTRLHWVASVGGRRAEWDAKILEQHPNQQISWISEDGKKNRGTVSFESLDASHTVVRLSLGYHAEGFVEAVGSAAGLDRRRIDADLMRFKELIEARGTETGAWREDISAGTKT